MNELGQAVVWVSLQVTLLSGLAVIVYAAAARRSARAGYSVITAFVAIVLVLTPVAYCPLPTWWKWEAPIRSFLRVRCMDRSEQAPLEEPTLLAGTDRLGGVDSHEQSLTTGGPRWSSGSLARLWNRLASKLPKVQGRQSPWAGLIGIGFTAGLCFFLARFLVGLLVVYRCCSGSRSIIDESMLALVERLRVEMACRRHVSLRECKELTTAAAAGWRRPVVLLPPDWPTWTELERRAVLAHEMAHVKRLDYPAWIAARLSIVLHFYHPVVQWLVRRLQLEQELAADSLAARFAGGSRAYLSVLAAMALRQDDRRIAWPVRAFLPAPGTLMRRIAMLRKGLHRPCIESGIVRRGSVLILIAAAIAVSALRTPTGAMGSSGNDSATAARGEKTGREDSTPSDAPLPAFELRWITQSSTGIYGFRPAAFFAHPEMQPYAEMLNQLLKEGLAEIALPAGFLLSVQDIEQITGTIQLAYDPERPEGTQHMVMFSLGTVRTTKDFDWEKQLLVWDPGMKSLSHNGHRVYFPASEDAARRPELGGPNPCFYVPDARTLVLGGNKDPRQWIEQVTAERPAASWAKDWKECEHSLIAFVFNDLEKTLPPAMLEEEPSGPLLAPVVKNTTHLVLGVSGGIDGETDLVVTALAGCQNENARATTRAALQKIVDTVRELAEDPTQQVDDEEIVFKQLFAGLARNARVDATLRGVRVESRSRISIPKLLQSRMPADSGS
jgi:beta-lactamase regulating signal transducer with metallopeptidase domain